MAKRRLQPRTPAQQLLDRLPPGALDDLLREDGGPQTMLQTLTAARVERALEAELTHHLGYEPGASPPPEQANRRNGTTGKTLRTKDEVLSLYARA